MCYNCREREGVNNIIIRNPLLVYIIKDSWYNYIYIYNKI